MASRFHHHWHLVAVDCAKRECPEVQQANVTFFHPNSNGKDDACRDASVGLGPHSNPPPLRREAVQAWPATFPPVRPVRPAARQRGREAARHGCRHGARKGGMMAGAPDA